MNPYEGEILLKAMQYLQECNTDEQALELAKIYIEVVMCLNGDFDRTKFSEQRIACIVDRIQGLIDDELDCHQP